jgi:hypothetical protein
MPRKPARAPKPLARTVSLAVALEELRQPGCELVHLHLPAKEGGHGFYIAPDGGRISNKDAAEILERADVQPHSAGLFPETVQSWRMVRRHERGARARGLAHTAPGDAATPVRDLSWAAGRRTDAMAIGKRRTGGETTPLLKFDARVGRFYVQDRVLEGGSWQTVQADVSDGFRAIFDLPNLQQGWVAFPKGEPPSAVLFPAGAEIGDPPSDDHKQGLRVLAVLEGETAARELTSTAIALWAGMDALHDAYLAAAPDHPNELPVVELAGVHEVKNKGGGVSHQPTFRIVGWTTRPPGMPATAAPRSQAQPKVKAKAKPKRGDMDDEIPF